MPHPRLAIVGGGLSGLLCAYFYKGPCKVFEQGKRVGGWVASEELSGNILEWGPHTVLADKEWEELFQSLGLAPIEALSEMKRRWVWREGSLKELPLNPSRLIGSSFFSIRSKLMIAKAFFQNPKIPEDDLSVREFFYRLLGDEITTYAVEPFVGGIFAGNAEELSASACFPRVWDAAKSSKAWLRHFISQAKSRAVSFPKGMKELPEALKEKLEGQIFLSKEVLAIERQNASWRLRFKGGDCEDFDQIVLTTPSSVSSQLLQGILSKGDLDFLSSIPYRDVMVWNTLWGPEEGFPDGFGCLIPPVEGQSLLGSLWPSRFLGRGGDYVSAQFFAGSSIPEDPATELGFLKRLLGLQKDPLRSTWRLHKRAIPQPQLNHRKRVQGLRARLLGGLFLAGNYLDGVGLSSVFRTAKSVALELNQNLERERDVG